MNLLLNKRELLDLGEELRGVRIECMEGRCWLTQSGDSRDHILGAGDSFTVRTNGQLIITATERCRFMLVQTAPQGRRPDPFKAINGILKGCVTGT